MNAAGIDRERGFEQLAGCLEVAGLPGCLRLLQQRDRTGIDLIVGLLPLNAARHCGEGQRQGKRDRRETHEQLQQGLLARL
jgi:hypothetical protein